MPPSTVLFPFFPLLPYELRAQIWTHALPPRRHLNDPPTDASLPTLITCKESRAVTLTHYTLCHYSSPYLGRGTFYADLAVDVISWSLYSPMCNGSSTASRGVHNILIETLFYHMRHSFIYFMHKELLREREIGEIILVMDTPHSFIIGEAEKDMLLRLVKNEMLPDLNRLERWCEQEGRKRIKVMVDIRAVVHDGWDNYLGNAVDLEGVRSDVDEAMVRDWGVNRLFIDVGSVLSHLGVKYDHEGV